MSSREVNEVMATFGSETYTDDKVATKPISLLATLELVI